MQHQPATTAVILGLTADTTINLILLIVCLCFVTGTVLVLATTREQRRLSDWLNARADARDYQVKQYARYRKMREVAEQKRQARVELGDRCPGCQHLRTEHGVLGCAVCSVCRLTEEYWQ